MGSVVLAGATSGSTTITPTDAVTATLTLPSTGGTLQTSGAGFTTNGVAYATSTSALATGSSLVWTGSALGIGTSSPSYPLVVNGSTNPVFAVTTSTIQAFVQADNNTSGAKFGSLTNHSIQFMVNNGESARIDTSGNLLVGVTSWADGSLFKTASGKTALSAYRASSSTDSGILAVYSDVGGTQTLRAYLRLDGGLANYSANNLNLSDERLKKNINPASDYLAKICAIPVKTFLYKDQAETEDLTLGVIAQDVQKIAPELISNDGFGTNNENQQDYLSVYQTDLQYALMKSIQELSALVTAQSATITSLTERITALEGK
jgi:Chaperone of endosialidase